MTIRERADQRTEEEKYRADPAGYTRAVVLRCQQDIDFAFRMRQRGVVEAGGKRAQVVGAWAYVYAQAINALDRVEATLELSDEDDGD